MLHITIILWLKIINGVLLLLRSQQKIHTIHNALWLLNMISLTIYQLSSKIHWINRPKKTLSFTELNSKTSKWKEVILKRFWWENFTKADVNHSQKLSECTKSKKLNFLNLSISWVFILPKNANSTCMLTKKKFTWSVKNQHHKLQTQPLLVHTMTWLHCPFRNLISFILLCMVYLISLRPKETFLCHIGEVLQ